MNNLLTQLKVILLRLRFWISTQQAMPTQPTQQGQPQPKLPLFFAAIRMYEGANPANNNPYDFRYYRGGYLPKYGVVKCSSGGFAMFSTLALGMEYGETCITEMIHNHPEWNFLDFFNVYSPVDDNNDPTLYADTVAKEVGAAPTDNLKTTLGI